MNRGAAARNVRLTTVMVDVYGAAAAMLRGDPEGVRVMVEDLREACGSVADALTIVSVLTLDRIGEMVAAPGNDPPAPVRPEELMSLATTFSTAPRAAVHAAAWRLDAVRCHDESRARRDVRRSLAAGTDEQLIAGAVALLTAVIVAGAIRRGRSAAEVACQLCLSASFGRAS
jgi:hypothetical protein